MTETVPGDSGVYTNIKDLLEGEREKLNQDDFADIKSIISGKSDLCITNMKIKTSNGTMYHILAEHNNGAASYKLVPLSRMSEW